MRLENAVMSFRRLWPTWIAAARVRRQPDSGNAQTPTSKSASEFPAPADVESYRSTVEKVFMTDRGGTEPGYAACVMCHTWQTSVRFSLETPATDAGWTTAQSRQNFDVVTKLVNTADPESSRTAAQAAHAGGRGLGTYRRHLLEIARRR